MSIIESQTNVYPPHIKRTTTPLQTVMPDDSNNALLSSIYKAYREKIRDPKRISILEPDAYPKIPAVTNLFAVPTDTYHAAKSFIRSIKERDHEEAQDATASLLSVPMNIGSSVGTLLNYGVNLHFLPHSLSILVIPTYIFGLVLCIIEGIIDSIGLHRQQKFSKEFDFKLIKNLKILLEKPDVVEGYRAFTEILSNLKENCDKDEAEAFYRFLSELKQQLDEKPHYRKFILEKFNPQLKELAQIVLAKNILHLQEDYLQLNPNEVEKITKHIDKKYHDLPIEEQREKLFQRLDQALNKKRRTLARRIRPWMVHEAADTIHPILMGLTSPKEENHELALNESLSLMEDIRFQSVKKKIVHVIGIIALVLAAASLVALLAGCPYAVPLALISIATIVATGRFLAFSGSLDVRGWDFSFRDTLPDFIRKHIWHDLPMSHPEMLKRRKVIPLAHSPYAQPI